MHAKAMSRSPNPSELSTQRIAQSAFFPTYGMFSIALNRNCFSLASRMYVSMSVVKN